LACWYPKGIPDAKISSNKMFAVSKSIREAFLGVKRGSFLMVF
jgi:hypothetical protein